MNHYSRKYLRERFLAEQQTQLAEDSRIDDPAIAYRQLIEELWASADDECPEHDDRAAA